MAVTMITIAFVARVVLMNSGDIMLDLVLPLGVTVTIVVLYCINKYTTQMKHYFQIFAVPLIGFLTARKSLVQNGEHFYLNESFASWLIMMIYASFSTPKEWYLVAAINLLCFISYMFFIVKHYGMAKINNDFYVHLSVTLVLQATLTRMNEVSLRNSF